MSVIPPDPPTTDVENPIQDPDASDAPVVDNEESNVATPEHCFHAFDALYCAITGGQSVEPTFEDDK